MTISCSEYVLDELLRVQTTFKVKKIIVKMLCNKREIEAWTLSDRFTEQFCTGDTVHVFVVGFA